MKNFLLSVLCAAALLLGGACEKIIEFHGPQVEPQLTMSSQATVGEPLRAYFSTSVFFLDSDRNGQAFKDKLDPALASVRCYVNGELRQNSNTKYMITTVEEAISELSQGMTLQKGTVIATGTPAGVAMGMNPPIWLKSGDKVCCEIENIGVLENTVA